jgi:hypothetical protein
MKRGEAGTTCKHEKKIRVSMNFMFPAPMSVEDALQSGQHGVQIPTKFARLLDSMMTLVGKNTSI